MGIRTDFKVMGSLGETADNLAGTMGLTPDLIDRQALRLVYASALSADDIDRLSRPSATGLVTATRAELEEIGADDTQFIAEPRLLNFYSNYLKASGVDGLASPETNMPLVDYEHADEQSPEELKRTLLTGAFITSIGNLQTLSKLDEEQASNLEREIIPRTRMLVKDLLGVTIDHPGKVHLPKRGSLTTQQAESIGALGDFVPPIRMRRLSRRIRNIRKNAGEFEPGNPEEWGEILRTDHLNGFGINH